MKSFKLDKQKKYLIAVSFGPDSMALLHMAFRQKLNIEVAHVNYHYRKEANHECEQLKQYCHSNSITFHGHDAVHDKQDGNFQNWAREIRYQFFHKIYTLIKADALLIAHNLDDHIETAIMQKMRKNNIIYMGIADETVIKEMNIVRPLLNIRKQHLMDYCIENSVPYAIDITNLKPDYLRNRIRHQIVQKMSELEVAGLIDEIKKFNIKTSKEITKAKQFIIDNQLSINQFLEADQRQAFILLWLLIHDKLPNLKISNNFIIRIRQACLSKKPNWKTRVNDDYWLIRSYQSLLVHKMSQYTNNNYSYVVTKPQRIDTPYFYFDLTSKQCPEVILLGEYPLTIRNYQPNDKIVINGIKRSVRRLFIDWKLPTQQRVFWPIITNKNGMIIYIPRYQSDFNPINRPDFYVKRGY
jgi:tRNA(Ile)-lysidine synthetase-like protein